MSALVKRPILTDIPRSLRRTAGAAILFALGVAVNLYYGRRGFMPLDQGIVFDGAWRLMQGQVPYRDFTAPNALVPSLLQVPFFLALGVTWFAFVLHASVINGLFCVLAYATLRACDATRAEAFVFAACSAFFFYPPNGTPFMDQHAFFFTTLAFHAVYAGSVTDSAVLERRWWMAVPPLLVLAFLSKQIPTAFGALAIAAWISVNPSRAPRWVASAALGAAGVAIAIAVAWMVMRFSLSEAWNSLIVMPLEIGRERTPGESAIAPLRLVLGTTRQLPQFVHLWSVWAAVAALIPLVFARGSAARRRDTLWLLSAILFTTGGFSAYTLNQIENGFCLLMLAAGIGAIVIRQTIANLAPAAWAKSASIVAAIVVIAVATRDTARFAVDVDATRIVLDSTFDAAKAARAQPYLPHSLKFMEWMNDRCTAEQFSALLSYLESRPNNFVLISDMTPLYALTGKPSVSPALWLHPGLTFPHPTSVRFAAFEERLLARMRQYDVRDVVVDDPFTGRALALWHFPRLQALVRDKSCGQRTFGCVRVFELCE